MCVSACPAESAARSQTSTGTHAKSTGTGISHGRPTTGGQPTMAAGVEGRRLAFEPSLPRARDYVRACLGLGLLRSMLAPMALRHGAAAGGIHKMLSRLAVDSGLLPAQVKELRWRGARARLRRGAVPTIWGQGRRGACESRSKGTVTPSPTLPSGGA